MSEHPVPTSRPPWRILVVDDEPDCAFLLRVALQVRFDETCQVIEAHGALETFEAVEACDPDLVITGGNQPVMSGWEVTRAMRAQGFDKPIIIWTACGPEYLSLAVGANAHFEKGELNTMLDAVELLLDGEPDDPTWSTARRC